MVSQAYKRRRFSLGTMLNPSGLPSCLITRVWPHWTAKEWIWYGKACKGHSDSAHPYCLGRMPRPWRLWHLCSLGRGALVGGRRTVGLGPPTLWCSPELIDE